MDIAALLGDDASLLLDHTATAFPKEWLTVPGPTFLQDTFTQSDRTPTVLRNLGTLYNPGRLGVTGYVSILPVDQGIEHSGAASFAPNPQYFDPARLCDLAIAADCNAIATMRKSTGSPVSQCCMKMASIWTRLIPAVPLAKMSQLISSASTTAVRAWELINAGVVLMYSVKPASHSLRSSMVGRPMRTACTRESPERRDSWMSPMRCVIRIILLRGAIEPSRAQFST